MRNNLNAIGPAYFIASSIAAVAIGVAVPAYEQVPDQLGVMRTAKQNLELALENAPPERDGSRSEYRAADEAYGSAARETSSLVGRALLSSMVAGMAIWGAAHSTRTTPRRRAHEVDLRELFGR